MDPLNLGHPNGKIRLKEITKTGKGMESFHLMGKSEN